MNINLNELGVKRVAVISDPHLDHQRDFVWQARGFDSPEHHKQSILGHLEQLGQDDILICLGDFFLNTNPENVKAALDRIKCRTLLIWGNHPAGIKSLYDKALQNIVGFNKVQNLGVKKEIYPLEIHSDKWMMGNDFFFSFNKKHYYCNHYPQIIWDGVQHGVVCLCGHSHGNFEKANPEEKNFGKMMDCGVDNALKTVGRPFFWLDEIDEIMKTKTQKVWDHHG